MLISMGQVISSSQFYLYGKRNFTRTGYLRHVESYSNPVQSTAEIPRGAPNADGVDLDGKVIVITGANSGLGKEVTTYAAAKGARVYMLCRSMQRAEPVRQEIATKTKNKNIKILLADVGEKAQVRKVSEELKGLETKIDCLVCNAGVLLNERKETSDGFEATFASHLLGGTYLLTKLLLPLLNKGSPQSRVVIVTSGGMYNTKWPSWSVGTNEKGENYDGVMAYAYAKRGQVLAAEEFAKSNPNVKFVTTHPGWVDTNALDEAFGESKKYLGPLRSSWEGAEGIGWLVATDAKNLINGALYLDRTPQSKHLAGPFFSQGSFTKNKAREVDELMARLKTAADSK